MLLHAGDLFGHVVERLQVLDVERGDDVDAGVEQLIDILPSLGVPAAGHVGVGEVVDQRDLRMAGEHRVEIHFGEGRAAVGHRAPRHDLQPFGHRRGQLPAVRFQQPDDDVRATGAAALRLAEHRVGLADTWCGAEIDAELSPGHTSTLLSELVAQNWTWAGSEPGTSSMISVLMSWSGRRKTRSRSRGLTTPSSLPPSSTTSRHLT